jgi:hypothetical protein
MLKETCTTNEHQRESKTSLPLLPVLRVAQGPSEDAFSETYGNQKRWLLRCCDCRAPLKVLVSARSIISYLRLCLKQSCTFASRNGGTPFINSTKNNSSLPLSPAKTTDLYHTIEPGHCPKLNRQNLPPEFEGVRGVPGSHSGSNRSSIRHFSKKGRQMLSYVTIASPSVAICATCRRRTSSILSSCERRRATLEEDREARSDL